MDRSEGSPLLRGSGHRSAPRTERDYGHCDDNMVHEMAHKKSWGRRFSFCVMSRGRARLGSRQRGVDTRSTPARSESQVR